MVLAHPLERPIPVPTFPDAQANHGCDFDFLEGTAPIADPEIH